LRIHSGCATLDTGPLPLFWDERLQLTKTVRTTKRTKINLFIVIYQLSRFKKSSYKFHFTKTDKVTAKI